MTPAVFLLRCSERGISVAVKDGALTAEGKAVTGKVRAYVRANTPALSRLLFGSPGDVFNDFNGSGAPVRAGGDVFAASCLVPPLAAEEEAGLYALVAHFDAPEHDTLFAAMEAEIRDGTIAPFCLPQNYTQAPERAAGPCSQGSFGQGV